jgi:hypothetical protein
MNIMHFTNGVKQYHDMELEGLFDIQLSISHDNELECSRYFGNSQDENPQVRTSV